MPKYKKRADGRYATTVKVKWQKDSITVYARSQKELAKKVYELKYGEKPVEVIFSDIKDQWLETKENTISITTFKTYEVIVKHLESLYPFKMEDIQIKDVQLIVDTMKSKGFAKDTIKKTMSTCSMIFDYAIINGVKVTNIVKYVKIPSTAKYTPTNKINDNEVEKINENLNVAFGEYAFILINTGLRPGELAALQWQDIDFDNKIIKVSKAVEYPYSQPIIKAPKTANGIREIPIIDNLLPVLKSLKEEALKSYKNIEELYIIGNEKPMSKTMIRRRWDKYKKETGLEITRYQLRHTFCTFLYHAGIDVKTTQKIMGHADIKTTLKIYTHLDESLNNNTHDKINSFFANKK